ncbi:protein-disulfide reductase DsbD domain-containing protein [Puniceibacterium sediminis]|uniref:Disulphide bond corrector protein DsbC n=1 Tax=Puniceibacterium sediminis TaxID=1608407 RepID=A0A238VJC5_9RHOB|nr:protein-disulfide reductase DsbD domain-containing protein [Puniceibacterium sediminis]SNR34475.1 Disulphide bond corrector protein DsbC [Puniceibacterium sediminis]
MKHALSALLCALLLPVPAFAQDVDNIVRAELRPGWRQADGSHVAALHLTLAPGWKTYWRSPGDAGIPPEFSWQGSDNVSAVGVNWPTPKVFYQSGMRSVGYAHEVVLPLRVTGRTSGTDMRLHGVVELGVCSDICVPQTVEVNALLPAAADKPDPMIAGALADMPFSRAEASVKSVRCTVGADDRGMTLRTEIDMPRGKTDEETVIETSNPLLWIAEPKTHRAANGNLISETRLAHVEGSAFALDRSGLRITVLSMGHAVDIIGCDG